MTQPNRSVPYVRPDGKLTDQGIALLSQMARDIADLRARVAALESP